MEIMAKIKVLATMKGREKERKRCETATKMAFDGLDRSVGIVKALMTFSHRGGSKKTETDPPADPPAGSTPESAPKPVPEPSPELSGEPAPLDGREAVG